VAVPWLASALWGPKTTTIWPFRGGVGGACPPDAGGILDVCGCRVWAPAGPNGPQRPPKGPNRAQKGPEGALLGLFGPLGRAGRGPSFSPSLLPRPLGPGPLGPKRAPKKGPFGPPFGALFPGPAAGCFPCLGFGWPPAQTPQKWAPNRGVPPFSAFFLMIRTVPSRRDSSNHKEKGRKRGDTPIWGPLLGGLVAPRGSGSGFSPSPVSGPGGSVPGPAREGGPGGPKKRPPAPAETLVYMLNYRRSVGFRVKSPFGPLRGPKWVKCRIWRIQEVRAGGSFGED